MSPRATDWDRYYQRSAFTSRFTRPFTIKRLLAVFERYGESAPIIAELGGANSCIYTAIAERIRPAEYHVVDNNQYGLDLLRRRVQWPGLVFHRANVIGLDLAIEADIVFSIGLIEHFDVAGTREAVQAHFRLLKPGGIAVITFPTPTWLYRATRGFVDFAGMWAFPDERPLLTAEVAEAVRSGGDLLHEDVIWPILLTQGLTVFRKR